MPTDAETLKWVTVDDFSPGIYDPRGTVLDSRGPSQTAGAQTGAPLGAAQLLHALEDVTPIVLHNEDSSGNGFDFTINSRGADVAGLITGDNAVSIADTEIYIGSGALDDTALTGQSVWVCGWVNDVSQAFVIWEGNGSSGFSPTLSLFTTPDTPGVSYFLCFTRRWGITNGGDVDFKSVSLPVTAGPHFLFGSYNASTDTFKLYEDGILVLTSAGTGHAVSDANIHTYDLGWAVASGAQIYDEIAFGFGVIADATVAALFAARGDFATYSAAQLAMIPKAYYHLNGSPRSIVTYPGTFRCVRAPGKGLIGAPRKLPDASVTQEFPIVSSLRSGSTTTNQNDRLADISGNGHHGTYDPVNISRAPGVNPSSAAINLLVASTSPTVTPQLTPVATTTFDGDWTANFWCDDQATGTATVYTLLDVVNTGAGSSEITITRKDNAAGNAFQLVITRRWAAGGGNIQTWTQTPIAALANGYHMLTVKYTLATDVVRILIDGVLIETIAGSGAAGSVLSANIDHIVNWLHGSIGTYFDEVSFHPSVLTDPQVATIFAAATSQGAYQAAVMARSPDSYYTFEEDGTHPTGENRALITASHLVSPILRSSATIQPTPPTATDAYQDGLFVSFSQFVDPAAGITYGNRIDARLYKLWTPDDIYDLDTGFTLGAISMTPLLRLDTTPWSAPFWHGVADWAEVVTGNGSASAPYFTQVCFLYNVVQSRQTAPYAAYIMGYPHPNTPATDSIITIALGGAGNFLTPELLFSHEGRLCDIDSHDGDLFGTNAARRGFNDINYWPIRDTSFGFGLPYLLPRPIEENQSGIRVAQSVNANELFLVKATGGGAVVSGDMDFPTIRRLPGLHSPGDIYAKPINTPLGVVYAGYGGVYLWSGAESSQLLSPQFDGPFWHPYLGAFSTYTPAANRFGFVGGFGWLHPFILAPSFFLFDTRFNSWWVLDDPSDLYPSLFMHGTAQDDILAVYPEINATNSTLADRYDTDLMATDFAWTSQPITPEMFRVAQVREINIQATSTSDIDDAIIQITVAGEPTGAYEQETITLKGDGRPHTYRAPFALQTETFIVTLESFGGTIDGDTQAAPIIHSFRVGYETLAEHPKVTT